MATNTEHPRRFDLRETIPLATETLIALAKRPKRSWIVPALTLFAAVAMAALMLELIFSPGSASALGFRGGLRSKLLADYAEDPIAARIHELRLTIVEDVLGMDDGDGSGFSAIALLMKDPVPTATPKSTAIHTSTAAPSPSPGASSEPTLVMTASPLPGPSSTPPPPTAVAMGEPCNGLSITSMEVDGDDVETRVRNNGSKHVYLIETFFEWPDVPEPAYVDWFKFDGDRYYTSNDSNSPTISTGDYEKLRSGKTWKWEVDFDDGPDGGIYGSFSVTLTFDVPDQETHCSLSRSIFEAPPDPTPEPTNTPGPTDTPEPVSTDTPEPTPTDTAAPSNTPVATATASATPLPTETPTPIDTPTPVDTPTLEPPAATETP